MSRVRVCGIFSGSLLFFFLVLADGTLASRCGTQEQVVCHLLLGLIRKKLSGSTGMIRGGMRLHRGCFGSTLHHLELWPEDLLVCVIFGNNPAQWNVGKTVILWVNDLCASRVIADLKKCCLSISKCILQRSCQCQNN